jgi:eukaryotic-like serine/threonine-protein kinase
MSDYALETPRPHPPGAEIAPGYRVITHLRRGADLDAYDTWSDQRYARCFVKTPRPDRSGADAVRGRLLLEGRILLGLTHPHFVRAYDLVEPAPDRPPVLVLETLTGAHLGGVLHDRRRRLSTSGLARLGRQLCSAIRYLHDRGYLHLDLKPSNIIAEHGTAKVLDLSLARTPGTYSPGVGTRAYLSPEQAEGDYLDAPADVWGIGVVLYEAATLVRPFEASRAAGEPTYSGDPTYYQQLCRMAPSVRAFRRLPRVLAEAIDGCLQPKPADRPTVPELCAACVATIGGEASNGRRARATV